MKLSQVGQAGETPPPEVAWSHAQNEGPDFPPVVAAMPATERQVTMALAVVVFLTIAALALAPFAKLQVTRVDAFIPVVQTVMSAADLLTAVLLFAQYSIRPQLALLALASGYIFSGSFAFLQTLAFPGAYAPAGLIGDEFNTSAWLFVLWNTTFTAAILVYALSKDTKTVTLLPRQSTRASVALTVACALVLVVLLTWLVTAKTQYLPSLFTRDVTLQTRFANLVDIGLAMWGCTALLVVLARKRTVLDLWLMVTLLAWLPNFLVGAIAGAARFSLGWYAARCFVLIGSCMLLTVLLTETTFLYSRLASALILQRRERANRLLSVDAVMAMMAHELRTPLAAIALNANAASSQLRSNPPRLDELRDILSDIETDSYRAGEIITSIRELLKKTAVQRTPLRVESVVLQALKLMRHELQLNEISVETEFGASLGEMQLDGTQLQQVLLNLIKNAIDAMSVVSPIARRLCISAELDGDSTLLLSVGDSGPGIPLQEQNRIFDPFFTTKASGTGLGLAICSSVVENHGGRLRLLKSDDTGSIFEIAIPVKGHFTR